MENDIRFINQAELLNYLRVCSQIVNNNVQYNKFILDINTVLHYSFQRVEEFTRQQLFEQVVGAQEINQATIDLIARINVNDLPVANIHIGNNVNEDMDE